MANIINPYGLLEESINEINFCWKGLVNTGMEIYLSRLDAVVDQAEKRLNRLTPEERDIVANIMGNRRRVIFDGSYITDLRDFLGSFWDEYDLMGEISKEDYIKHRCTQKALERRMEEVKEDIKNNLGSLTQNIGDLLGKLLKED